MPNPQSPDRSIPPLSGADFRREFNTPAKIVDVIRSLTTADVNAFIAHLATLQ